MKIKLQCNNMSDMEKLHDMLLVTTAYKVTMLSDSSGNKGTRLYVVISERYRK